MTECYMKQKKLGWRKNSNLLQPLTDANFEFTKFEFSRHPHFFCFMQMEGKLYTLTSVWRAVRLALFPSPSTGSMPPGLGPGLSLNNVNSTHRLRMR